MSCPNCNGTLNSGGVCTFCTEANESGFRGWDFRGVNSSSVNTFVWDGVATHTTHTAQPALTIEHINELRNYIMTEMSVPAPMVHGEFPVTREEPTFLDRTQIAYESRVHTNWSQYSRRPYEDPIRTTSSRRNSIKNSLIRIKDDSDLVSIIKKILKSLKEDGNTSPMAETTIMSLEDILSLYNKK